MDAVVDTVTLNHLLRKPKIPNPKNRTYKAIDSVITLGNAMQQGKLQLALDEGRGLLSEWEETCGEETVRALIIRWTDLNGIKFVKPHNAIQPRSVARKLTQLGFRDTVDKLVVRIALSLINRRVVSNDSDFWDPSQKVPVGNVSGPVVSLMKHQLGIRVMLLVTLIRSLLN